MSAALRWTEGNQRIAHQRCVIIWQIMEAAPLGFYNNVIDDDKHVTYLLT